MAVRNHLHSSSGVQECRVGHSKYQKVCNISELPVLRQLITTVCFYLH
jgi:hypothetical protein